MSREGSEGHRRLPRCRVFGLCLCVQVVLEHKKDPECQVPRIAEQAARENLIDVGVLERDWETRIRTWSRAGLGVTSMNRLIELEIVPLQLGPTGRRKVSCIW